MVLEPRGAFMFLILPLPIEDCDGGPVVLGGDISGLNFRDLGLRHLDTKFVIPASKLALRGMSCPGLAGGPSPLLSISPIAHIVSSISGIPDDATRTDRNNTAGHAQLFSKSEKYGRVTIPPKGNGARRSWLGIPLNFPVAAPYEGGTPPL